MLGWQPKYTFEQLIDEMIVSLEAEFYPRHDLNPCRAGPLIRALTSKARLKPFALWPRPQHRRNLASIALVFAILPALVVFAILGLPMLAGQIYTEGDLGDAYMPLKSFYARQLKAGQAFDWCPDLYCGCYLQGEGQVSMYHPLVHLAYRWLPFAAAYDLDVLLRYPLMLAGMFLLLRRWQLPAGPAMFGAVTFTFSGFNLLHFAFPGRFDRSSYSLDVAVHRHHRRDRQPPPSGHRLAGLGPADGFATAAWLSAVRVLFSADGSGLRRFSLFYAEPARGTNRLDRCRQTADGAADR